VIEKQNELLREKGEKDEIGERRKVKVVCADRRIIYRVDKRKGI